MSETVTRLSPRSLDTGFDGRSSARQLIRENDEQGLSSLLLVPGLLYAALAAMTLGYMIAVGGDYAQMHSTVGALQPGLSEWQRHAQAAALTLGYVGVWHTCGHRAFTARVVALRSPGNAGSPLLRAFGLLGAVTLVIGLATLIVLSVSRAWINAERAGHNAARRVVEDALDGPVDLAAVAQARATAYESAFWPELWGTLVCLLVLAMLSLLLGMASVRVKEAVTVTLAGRGLARARKREGSLRQAEAAAHLELASRVEARDRAGALAEMHDRELPHRFDAAKERFKLAVAQGLGEPSRTSVLTAEQEVR